MSNIVIFDINTKRILRLLPSVHTPDYDGRTDVLVNPVIPNVRPADMIVDKRTVREMTQEEKDQRDADILNTIPYDVKRAQEYPPVGDQLDALLKQLNFDRFNGKELIQDMDDIIGEWLAVKAKYPKPE